MTALHSCTIHHTRLGVSRPISCAGTASGPSQQSWGSTYAAVAGMLTVALADPELLAVACRASS